MLKFIENAFVDLGYNSYERIEAVRGSRIEIISELASEKCQDSDLIVIKSGINNNNILGDYRNLLKHTTFRLTFQNESWYVSLEWYFIYLLFLASVHGFMYETSDFLTL